MKFINQALSIRCVKRLHQKKCEIALFMLITIEFSRFCIMYLLAGKTITSGPARNSHTHGV